MYGNIYRSIHGNLDIFGDIWAYLGLFGHIQVLLKYIKILELTESIYIRMACFQWFAGLFILK